MMKRDPFYQHQTCRGVSWNDSTAYAAPADSAADQQAATAAVAECPRRIIASTVDARLFALNADTGALCKAFGTDGYVDLMKAWSILTGPPTSRHLRRW
jgi:quinoprotein glucose dehydrogenase